MQQYNLFINFYTLQPRMKRYGPPLLIKNSDGVCLLDIMLSQVTVNINKIIFGTNKKYRKIFNYKNSPYQHLVKKYKDCGSGYQLIQICKELEPVPTIFIDCNYFYGSSYFTEFDSSCIRTSVGKKRGGLCVGVIAENNKLVSFNYNSPYKWFNFLMLSPSDMKKISQLDCGNSHLLHEILDKFPIVVENMSSPVIKLNSHKKIITTIEELR